MAAQRPRTASVAVRPRGRALTFHDHRRVAQPEERCAPTAADAGSTPAAPVPKPSGRAGRKSVAVAQRAEPRLWAGRCGFESRRSLSLAGRRAPVLAALARFDPSHGHPLGCRRAHPRPRADHREEDTMHSDDEIHDQPSFRANEQAPARLPQRAAGQDRHPRGARRQGAAREAGTKRPLPLWVGRRFHSLLPPKRPPRWRRAERLLSASAADDHPVRSGLASAQNGQAAGSTRPLRT